MPELIFPADYTEARSAFRKVAKQHGAYLGSHAITGLRGLKGERLTVDLAGYNLDTASRLILVSSGVHGNETPPNSYAQTMALASDDFRTLPAQVGVLMVHALNPYGFSYNRRVTHEGVDLNRNFLEWDKPLPPTSGPTALLNQLILAGNGRDAASQQADLKIQDFIRTHGESAYESALSGGQFDIPQGLFYGGRGPTWSARCWSAIVDRYAAGREQVVHLDLHTGYGPRGALTLLPAAYSSAADLDIMQRWWGKKVELPGESAAFVSNLQGPIEYSLLPLQPKTKVLHVTAELGTNPPQQEMDALIADHRLHAHGGVALPHAGTVFSQMREALAPQDTVWEHKTAAALAGFLTETATALRKTRPPRP